ncbi:MAG TPA: hypothetical protein VKP61_00675 [Candidatus Acidoferrum sp.]|nr:hypothetical protein [Candidatus Acidoferrum sp.]
MHSTRLFHIARRADPLECDDAIAELREELLVNPHFRRTQSQIDYLERLKSSISSKRLSEKVEKVGQLIINAFEDGVEPTDCSCMKLTPHEREIVEALAGRGFEILRNGWPDFLVRAMSASGYAVTFGVEVKRKGEVARREQKLMHFALEQVGIPVILVRDRRNLRRRVTAILENGSANSEDEERCP